LGNPGRVKGAPWRPPLHGVSMELQEVKKTLSALMTELRCELTGWDKSIPVDALKGWIKKVDTRIIRKINDQHD